MMISARGAASVIVAFGIGIVFGSYFFPAKPAQPPAALPKKSTETQSLETPLIAKPISSPSLAAPESEEKPTAIETGKLIEKIQAALAKPGYRRTNAELAKVADLVNQNNVRDLLAFAETLTKRQEKQTLVSLLVGRWAEFDPQAAIAFVQSKPNDSSR